MLLKDANNLLAELGSSLGIEGLCFNDAASCQLVFDQLLVVTIILDRASQRITLNCPISQANQFDSIPRQTLLAMLQANFMGQGCPNATLSFASDNRAYLQIVIATSESTNCNLSSAVELLLNLAETWSVRLRQNHDLDHMNSPNISRTNRHLNEPLAWTRQKV